ncbi:dioxygenase [Amylibacter marinus]|uniref:Dioxygenase n=1 Tax=Amylibacter marinus TaxID=1475483 RepID=A0ABQ5VSQ1_9RHOB|nr:class III extradiol ring-cleavage dioxygenase [Amylibacter marinus]GLQ34248.1 dioxygenase [Amylibacter marinus]
MQSALFLPHGAPDLALSDIPGTWFLRGLFKNRPIPKGIVIISAHWETSDLTLTTAPKLDTIHDFGGFSSALNRLQYPAKTAPWLIDATKSALSKGTFAVRDDPRRGLDHGAWIPLMLSRPSADIPVVQLSLPTGHSPQDLFLIGRALATLAVQDILVIGSGATVHNLYKLAPEGTPAPQFAMDFDDWLERVFLARDWSSLFHFHSLESGRFSHPTSEHLLPLILVAGICDARPGLEMRNLHRSYSYGSIGMAAWEVSDAS